MTSDPDSDHPDQRTDIRPSPIAGLWYSSSPRLLSQEIDEYLQADLPSIPGTLIGVIAPHAGYRYSGRTAGYAFGCVKGQQYDLVVVMSPYHAYHSAPILTSSHRAYKTPLGEVPVDVKTLNTLEGKLRDQNISMSRVANDGEHSLEIELPFLQRALSGSFTLLPLMVRSHHDALLRKTADCLAEVTKDQRTLLVASTDLSHFYPESKAKKFDREMLHQFSIFSPEGVLAAERSGRGFACGAGAAAAALWTAQHYNADSVKILHHSTSADETGDRSSVVGYGAAAIYKKI